MFLQTAKPLSLVFPPPSVLNRGMDSAPANNNHAGSTQPLVLGSSYYRDLLLAVAQKKDKVAFAELFDYFAPRIKSFLIKGGATPDQAEELAQETMVAVWQKAATFNPAKANASTWIFTVARNKRIDTLRKKIRPETQSDDSDLIADETPLASETMAAEEESNIMAGVLKSLPQEQANLLYKSFFEDKTHADIAAETNIPLGTVKSRIRLALDKLRSDTKVKELWL